MTGIRVKLGGVDRLRSSASSAVQQIDRLAATAGDKAGTIVLEAVRPPILTGRLASTVHVIRTEQGFGIAAGGERAPYVAIVNARHPFVTPAYRDRESAVVNTYADALEQVVGSIQGA